MKNLTVYLDSVVAPKLDNHSKELLELNQWLHDRHAYCTFAFDFAVFTNIYTRRLPLPKKVLNGDCAEVVAWVKRIEEALKKRQEKVKIY